MQDTGNRKGETKGRNEIERSVMENRSEWRKKQRTSKGEKVVKRNKSIRKRRNRSG